MKRALPISFFREDTIKVAKGLLGNFLVRKDGQKIIKDIIVEVEIYHGPKDKASHAFRGLTKKTFPMFQRGGIWFVYLTYGMHWMLNVVTGEKNFPSAVLIRSTKNVNGPGRVTKHFKVDKSFNGLLINTTSKLWIEKSNIKIREEDIRKSGRVGVDYAGEYWKKRKWNFKILL